ncbi:hypothetical protein BPY_16200 [Bifidobacterium psychraerophilum]
MYDGHRQLLPAAAEIRQQFLRDLRTVRKVWRYVGMTLGCLMAWCLRAAIPDDLRILYRSLRCRRSDRSAEGGNDGPGRGADKRRCWILAKNAAHPCKGIRLANRQFAFTKEALDGIDHLWAIQIAFGEKITVEHASDHL